MDGRTTEERNAPHPARTGASGMAVERNPVATGYSAVSGPLAKLSVRLLAAVATAALLVLGVWVAGGVITNDFKTGVALTIAWGGLFGAVCLLVAVRSRALRVPVIVSYVATGVAVAGVLGYMTLHDRVVDEDIVHGIPASSARTSRTEARGHRAPAETKNVELASGHFQSVEHGSSGTAAVVRVAGGNRYLTFARFETSAGPDLRVRLVLGDSTDGGAEGALDLGGLKGNKGDQQYELPREADLNRYQSVVIWCRAFTVAFAQARLFES